MRFELSTEQIEDLMTNREGRAKAVIAEISRQYLLRTLRKATHTEKKIQASLGHALDGLLKVEGIE
jgi:hypothetical protein